MRSPNPEKLLEWLITLLLIATFLLVVVGSLFPFQLADSWTEIKAAFGEGKEGMISLDLKPDFATITERLLVFVPFGFLIYQNLMRRQQRRATLTSIGLVALVALAVEVAQAVISARHSRVLDFVLATAAGIVGIRLSIPFFQIFSRSAFDTVRQLLSGVLWLGNYLVVCICIAAIIPASIKISEWDCSYPLLIGNELTHERPWLGKIRGVAIYPRELADDEVLSLSHIPMTPDNTTLRNSAGAIALYSFVTGNDGNILMLNHKGPPLELAGEKEALGGWRFEDGALHIHKPLLIKSTGPADTICNTIMASQAFAMEVEIASGNLMQDGPARIISNSIDPSYRNFMLGEQKGDLVLRVRTPQNGSNGSGIPFETQGNVLAERWSHVAASYADGVAKLFVNGKEAATPLHYEKALFLGTALSVRTVLITGFLLLGMGVVAGIVFRLLPPFAAAAMCICSTSFVPILGLLTVALWLERHPSPVFVGAIMLIPFLGFVLCRKLRGHSLEISGYS